MRIHIYITMTGKMFGAGHDARILHSFHICNTKSGNFVFVFSKRTVTDNRIIGIIIDINNRSIINMNTHSLALFTNCQSHLVNNVVIA